MHNLTMTKLGSEKYMSGCGHPQFKHHSHAFFLPREKKQSYFLLLLHRSREEKWSCIEKVHFELLFSFKNVIWGRKSPQPTFFGSSGFKTTSLNWILQTQKSWLWAFSSSLQTFSASKVVQMGTIADLRPSWYALRGQQWWIIPMVALFYKIQPRLRCKTK